MSNHTPGPWVGFSDQGKTVAIMPAMREGDICTFNQPPSDADATLMILAPTLLKALQGAMVVLESMPRPTAGLVGNRVQAEWDKRVAAVRDALDAVGQPSTPGASSQPSESAGGVHETGG